MKKAAYIIRGGRLFDPSWGLDRRGDLLVCEGSIAALGGSIDWPGAEILDAGGCLVLPGLVDLHVHLRDPGGEQAEDVRSGSRAAAAGGFCTIVCMPNTRPALDRPEAVLELQRRIYQRSAVRVFVAGALSRKLQGKQLTQFAKLLAAGAVAISDDGVGTRNPRLLGEALRRAAELDLPVLLHCEERPGLGVMNEGAVAARLGLGGMPAASEYRAVERALELAAKIPARVHLQHISCAESLRLIRQARRQGIGVTCEATPHHLFLSEEVIERRLHGGAPDPRFKVNPPLRQASDVEVLRRALADGTVDAIASDHAPHTARAKGLGFGQAPFGMIGLETSLALVLRLVEEKVISLARAVELLSLGPARILKKEAGLRPGRPADVTVVDPRARWKVDPSKLNSRSRNTPFAGWLLRGRARFVLVAGRLSWRAAK